MKNRRRIVAGLLSGVLAVSGVAQLPAAVAEDGSTGSYDMQIAVKLDGTRKAISPYIYGVNDSFSETGLSKVKVNAVRQGGNRYTGYNWETNYSNAGRDWQNSSDTYLGDVTEGPASNARRLSADCATYGIPYKMTGLQMAGYVSADKNGAVSESEAAPSDRWNKVEFEKGSAFSDEPDLDDGVVYMDEYVNYLVKNLGDSTTATGIQGYNLDNEPVLWSGSHSLLHPNMVSNEELISKTVGLAKAVKKIDPHAETFGPAFWGPLACYQAGNGDSYTDPDWTAVKSQYSWYMDYYLKQMADAEAENGQRLLDVVDVHYYAQDLKTADDALQSARSLYDPDYQEDSWLGKYFGGVFPFLTRMQESIDQYYPGTKLALTEYNLENINMDSTLGKVPASAIAEAEALGAFADQGVYLAAYWGNLAECPYVLSAINLYTNYDGAGSAFGNTLVESSSEDLSKAAVFASIQDDQEGTVTTVLSNKSKTDTEKATIQLSGTETDYQSAVVYAVTQDSSDIQILDVQNDVSGNQVTVELPPLSVAQIVIADEKTDVVVPDGPAYTTEKVDYTVSDLPKSQEGYARIPLGDKEYLKEIQLHMQVSSSEGSTWAVGGGALCFQKVTETGTDTPYWGCKNFSYQLNSGTVTVPFDDQYKITVGTESKVVSGSCADTEAEIQVWWASSEKDEKNGSDITAVVDSVTLVYERPTQPGTTVTTTATTEASATETTTTVTTSASTADTVQTTADSGSVTTRTTESSTETTPLSSQTETRTETETATQTSQIDFRPASVLFGDVTLDGKVSLADAVLLNKAVADMVDLSEQAHDNADCNQDGEVNGADALVLVKFLVHLINSLPCAD